MKPYTIYSSNFSVLSKDVNFIRQKLRTKLLNNARIRCLTNHRILKLILNFTHSGVTPAHQRKSYTKNPCAYIHLFISIVPEVLK